MADQNPTVALRHRAPAASVHPVHRLPAVDVAASAPPSHAASVVDAQALAARFAGLHDASVRGDDEIIGASQYVSAVAHNSAGRYTEALLDARRAVAHHGGTFVDWALAELVEAAARTGRFDEARSAHARLETRARAAGTDLALGIRARSAALIADGPDAENEYLEAIDRLGRGRADVLLARTHLAYGEWLRRQQRRVEARTRAAARPRVARGSRSAPTRRTRPPGDPCHGRNIAAAAHQGTHAAGVGGGSARRRGSHQPRDRRADVHQCAHRRVSPAERVREARRELTAPAAG